MAPGPLARTHAFVSGDGHQLRGPPDIIRRSSIASGKVQSQRYRLRPDGVRLHVRNDGGRVSDGLDYGSLRSPQRILIVCDMVVAGRRSACDRAVGFAILDLSILDGHRRMRQLLRRHQNRLGMVSSAGKSVRRRHFQCRLDGGIGHCTAADRLPDPEFWVADRISRSQSPRVRMGDSVAFCLPAYGRKRARVEVGSESYS